MANPPKTYQRLTRNTVGLASYSSLWLASDHLLIVSSTGYTEKYARVMLRDIKGLFITATDRRMWWNFAWALVAMVALLRMILVLMDDQTPAGSVAFVVVSAAALAWSTMLGPGVRVQILTGVQTARLPALVRRNKARRVIARLQPLISAAQADLVAPAPVASATESMSRDPVASDASDAPPAGPVSP